MRTDALADLEQDQRVGLELTAPQFRKFLVLRGERSTPRLAYQEPRLELLSACRNHEVVKVLLCRLLEAWADERSVELFGMGSTTLKSPRVDQAIEPDASYLVGTSTGSVPHLSIEVVWTHRSERNLAIYAALGVREVWTWQAEELLIHVLRRGKLVASPSSVVLPTLDEPDFVAHLSRWRRPLGLLKAWREHLAQH